MGTISIFPAVRVYTNQVLPLPFHKCSFPTDKPTVRSDRTGRKGDRGGDPQYKDNVLGAKVANQYKNAAIEKQMAKFKRKKIKRNKGKTLNTYNPKAPSLEKLNDDCLYKILMKLPLVDRVRVERG